MAAGATSASAAFAHRAGAQILAELNQRSAGSGAGDVGVPRPVLHAWAYAPTQGVASKDSEATSTSLMLIYSVGILSLTFASNVVSTDV